MPPDLPDLQRKITAHDYKFTAHASDRAAEGAILSHEIEEAVGAGTVEDYPDDKYGPSCHIMGTSGNQRILHIQISYSPPLRIITVYEPLPDEWENDWKTRKSHDE